MKIFQRAFIFLSVGGVHESIDGNNKSHFHGINCHKALMNLLEH